jgi:hypothetical protein
MGVGMSTFLELNHADFPKIFPLLSLILKTLANKLGRSSPDLGPGPILVKVLFEFQAILDCRSLKKKSGVFLN